MRSKEYLEEIRRAEGLRRAVLRKIQIEGNKVVFHLVTDVSYSEEDVSHARSVSARYVPSGFTADARVLKSIPSEEGVRRAIADILRLRFPAVAAFVSPSDIEVNVDSGGGRFTIGVGDVERGQFSSDGVLDALTAELQRQFCGAWVGEFRYCEKERGEIEREEIAPAEFVAAPRFFPVEGYEAIDGANPERAIYIADLDKESSGVTVCGTVSYIEERVTKKGKPFFSVTVSDGTGQIRVFYFSKVATLEKIRGIAQGDSICITGDNELFNGQLSFRAKSIDYGRAPTDFVPEARPSRPVPARYKAVFPAPVTDFVQGMLFGETTLPADLVREEFVVFDLETTGLNNTGGNMDRIIEVGAVKIKEGKISEKFSSFVACPVKLTEEIVNLTGITDEMLTGAPDVRDVIADFYKFTAGCALVAHNMQFDYKFIRHYGEKEGFLFDRKLYDTLTLAREGLSLSNYQLNTVASHFGFTFNHHRAFDDAFVTAKIFIELVKLRGGLA